MPLRKGWIPTPDVNLRIRGYGRATLMVARRVIPHIRDPYELQHRIETTRRDIYAETVDAMGYDPLAQTKG